MKKLNSIKEQYQKIKEYDGKELNGDRTVITRPSPTNEEPNKEVTIVRKKYAHISENSEDLISRTEKIKAKLDEISNHKNNLENILKRIDSALDNHISNKRNLINAIQDAMLAGIINRTTISNSAGIVGNVAIHSITNRNTTKQNSKTSISQITSTSKPTETFRTQITSPRPISSSTTPDFNRTNFTIARPHSTNIEI